MAAQVGDKISEFKLKATGDREVSLSDYSGKPLVVLFYPLDFSPVCSVQVPEFNKRLDDIRATGADVIAINRDSVYAHNAWCDSLGGVGFPLLADLNLEVAKKFGVALDAGISTRAVFVLDGDGKVVFSHVEDAPANNTCDVDKVIEAIKSIG
jgi:peroxiredoxin (alkyl hydroperoxide reductase subunit C)